MDIGVCRSVVDRLQGVSVLHVGSLGFDPLRPLEQHAFDDLQVLIKEGDLAAFRQAMEAGQGFRLVRWNADTQGTELAWPGLVLQALDGRPRPLGPELGYANCVGAPCPHWIQFHTSQRHAPLLLVKLEGTDWFPGVAVSVLGDRTIMAPPLWARLLWQASVITIEAAGPGARATIRARIDTFHELAKQATAGDWNDLVAHAPGYDDEYLTRLERIRPRIVNYANALSVSPNRLISEMVGSPPARTPTTIAAADLDYGVLHDLRYALDALTAYYPDVVIPSNVTTAAAGGTGQRPRTVWRYGTYGGEVAVADSAFGIREQIEEYAGLTWDDLQARGLIASPPALRGASPQGYWIDLTPNEFQAIWASPP